MDNATIFARVMAGCGVVSLALVVFFLIHLCLSPKHRTFAILLVLLMVLSDMVTICGAFLRYGLSLEDTAPTLTCLAGEAMFNTSIYFTFGCAFALSLMVLLLTSPSVRVRAMAEGRRFRCFLVVSLFLSAALVSGLGYLIEPGMGCSGSSDTRYYSPIVWLLFTCADFTVLGIFYTRLWKVSGEAKVRGASLLIKVATGIALIVGVLRFPAFIMSFVTKGAKEGVSSDSPGILAAFTISFALTVLQPGFVVLLVSINHGVFRACGCRGSATTSSQSTDEHGHSHQHFNPRASTSSAVVPLNPSASSTPPSSPPMSRLHRGAPTKQVSEAISEEHETELNLV